MQELKQPSSEASTYPTDPSGTFVPGASPTRSAANSSDENAQGNFAPPALIPSPALFTYGVFSSTHSSLESTQLSSETSNVSATVIPDRGTVASAQAFIPSSAIHATSVPSNPSLNQSAVSASARPLNCPPFPLSASPRTAAASLGPSVSPIGPFAKVDSTSAVRPSTPGAPLLSNPTVHQHAYPLFHSVPSVGASPQGIWLPPPSQMGAFARPPFLSYAPPIYPVSFPLAATGMPLPSVPVPDSQPPGVTPVGNLGFIPMSSSAASVSHMTTGSATQKEVHTSLTDGNKGSSDGSNVERAAPSDKEEAWSAHRTETGAVYYYNAVTGESTYQKPIGYKGELDKVIAQPTPVSWEKLAGTEWSLVKTNDGKNYYYNTKTKTSSWHVPMEVAELRRKKDSEIREDNAVPVQDTNDLNEKGSGMSSLSAPALSNGGRDSTALRMPGMPGSSALDLVKKKLQESGAPINSSIPGPGNLEVNGSKTIEAAVKGSQGENTKEKPKETDGSGNMSDLSSDSEDSDSGPTMEERVIQFKEMLKERGVAPFSKWEKELPKIVFDPRFKAIPSYAERRSLFEHYVRTRAEEERKEKRAAQKASTEGFKQLLEEAKKDINENTNYHTFKKKWGNDLRFEALDRKEREHLLNERIVQFKRAAEEKGRAVRAAVASGFKSMICEKGDITASSRWSRVKEGFRDDPRYKAVRHEEREALFNEYISELKSVGDEAERAGKAEQDKLKERERELRKRKEREEQEMERVRVKIRRKEAVESFQALLVERIKDPQVSWTESKPKLEKDPQRRATNPDLDESDLEKLFREHIKMLNERCTCEFKALLAEVITVETAAEKTEDGKTVLTSWSTAKHLLKSDNRYKKLSGKERETLWRRHAEEVQRKDKDGKNGDLESKSLDPWRPSASRFVHQRR
ncbi:hypothetical protein V2J09_005946 [Rumex salicifolius]